MIRTLWRRRRVMRLIDDPAIIGWVRPMRPKPRHIPSGLRPLALLWLWAALVIIGLVHLLSFVGMLAR